MSAVAGTSLSLSPPLEENEVSRGPASLKAIFAPTAVALVGASPEFSRYGGRAWHFISKFGFSGPIWPVNPKYKEINGSPCYPDLKSLPRVPDHVGIVVAPERVLSILKECAKLGIQAVTVFTAGFTESGDPDGAALQEEIADYVKSVGIRMVGPNCNGLINWKIRFSMSATAALLEPKGKAGTVGVVSQSGGLGQINVMWRAMRAGLGISYQASCGNEADVDTIDVADFMIDDPDTRVILMAIEGIRDGDKLRRVAMRAARARKPIVMLKLGRSAQGAKAAASHTGAMTGADAVHDAVLEQFGILRVEDPQHLYHAAMLFQQGRQVLAEGVASASVSGGVLALMADQAERFGLSFPSYSPETLKTLSTMIPSFINIGNPTDLSVDVLSKAGGITKVLATLAADPAIGVMLPIQTMSFQRDLDMFIDFAKKSSKPTALIWSGGCTDQPYEEHDRLIDGVPVYRDVDTAMRAVGLLMRQARFLRKFEARGEARRPEGTDVDHARHLLARAQQRTLTERQSKQVLAAYGIPVTQEALATSVEEAVQQFQAMGAPVVMKIEAAEIMHKSDIGGVRLNIATEAQVREAFDAIMASARKAYPSAQLNGVLMQEMIPTGVEVILGCSTDPTYGPVLALGAGGIYAEYMGKPVLRLGPLTMDEARDMIDALPSRKILGGVRGKLAADIDVLADLIVRFSWLVADLGDLIEEIDINPLILNGASAIAVDGLIIRAESPQD